MIEGQVSCRDEARAEPIWCSWYYQVSHEFHNTWCGLIQLTRIDDIVNDLNESEARGVSVLTYIEWYLRQVLDTAGDFFTCKGGRLIPIKRLITQYKNIGLAIPDHVMSSATGSVFF